MRDAREEIEALSRAGHGFRDELSGDTRERDAVARESLHEVDVRREPAEVRRAIERDVEIAAPGIVDARVGELRKDAHQALARAPRRARVETRIAHAPAEQQPVVG